LARSNSALALAATAREKERLEAAPHEADAVSSLEVARLSIGSVLEAKL
jgi:hypothetical protein